MFAKNSAIALCLCSLLLSLIGPARADEILVSAASSLTDALTEVGAAYTKANPGTAVRFNFGASGMLKQQIDQGAPVDVFAAASPKEMDELTKEGKIVVETRVAFAGNRLVLIAPAGSSSIRQIKDWADLAKPNVKRIAVSNPASVPSGRYAQETLTRRGLWATLQPKIVLGTNVRQTLAYVAGGDADAGVVFATDAEIEKRVRIVATATPRKDHDPIIYPAAVIAGSPNAKAASAFVAFLKSPGAQAILRRYGFTPS